MIKRKALPYEIVELHETQPQPPVQGQSPHSYDRDHATHGGDEAGECPPELIADPLWGKILRVIIDLLVGTAALLFAVYGFLVYQHDGQPADPGTQGYKLFQVSQFVSSSSLTLLSPFTGVIACVLAGRHY